MSAVPLKERTQYMNIQIKNRYNNSVIFETDAENIGKAIEAALKINADLCEANLRRANLCGADLSGANLCGADLCEANLRGANLRGTGLSRANLCGANLRGKKIKTAKVFHELYKYIVMAIVLPDGTRIVKMGCLEKTLEEWDEIGIRKSNLNEFPDNGSKDSEERARAFEFAKATALAL